MISTIPLAVALSPSSKCRPMRPSRRVADPFTREMICQTIRRMGLLSNAEQFSCEPLSGGVSSDIWRIAVGNKKYCMKRALPRLKVAQRWEAPVGRNSYEWQWLRAAGAICPDCVPNLVAHDQQAGLFIMDYLDPKSYPVWKIQLRDGVAHEETAERAAERLVWECGSDFLSRGKHPSWKCYDQRRRALGVAARPLPSRRAPAEKRSPDSRHNPWPRE